jgi:hypothetical protein
VWSSTEAKGEAFEGKGEGFGLFRFAVFGFLVLAAAVSASVCNVVWRSW